jgi:hypothetical protein
MRLFFTRAPSGSRIMSAMSNMTGCVGVCTSNGVGTIDWMRVIGRNERGGGRCGFYWGKKR